MTAKEFWHTTPRKFSALCEMHAEMHKQRPKKNPKTVDGVPYGAAIANSRPKGQGVGEPNAFIDQL